MTYFNTAENQDVCDAVNDAIDNHFDLDEVKVDNTEIIGSLKELLKCAKSDRELLETLTGDMAIGRLEDFAQIKQGLVHTIEVLEGIVENDDDAPYANTDEATLLDVGSYSFAENLSTELEARGLRLVKS